MSQLVEFQIFLRNNVKPATTTSNGFDVEDIVVPIVPYTNASKSIVVARILKGSDVQAKNIGKTTYVVNHTVDQIAAMSSLLLSLTVVKRRNTVIPSVKYGFVASRISENIIPSQSGGSIFFYNEDGDPIPVMYEVEETVAQIVAMTNPVNPSGQITPLTWQQAQDIRDAGLLNPADGFLPGSFYNITDANGSDEGVIVFAVTETQLSDYGTGIFLNPDFQNLFGNNIGKWDPNTVPSIGDICILEGLQYSSVTGLAGTSPDSDNVNWSVIAKSDSAYIRESDFVIYDFDGNEIVNRKDKRRNDISGSSEISIFDWGNDLLTDIIINKYESNLSSDIDMTTAFSAGVLTIPSSLRYCGIFNLKNDSGQVINKISNLPPNYNCLFTSNPGESYTFNHVSISVAVADNMVSDAAAANIIVGDNGDKIWYKKSGTLNQRTNIVKIA